ncbi:YhfL [Enterobacter ludwigii]|uniref:YhfL n=4 Tax=Enterobacter cloacae complex TaxID=354276 RepID=G8LI90_9ENTR|nr:YhfL [Enterobacter ludwigii]
MEFFHLFPHVRSNFRFFRQGMRMFKLAKAAVLVGMLSTLTACTGHVQNTKNNCSYDYLLHPAISISKIIGGCGPAAQQ